MSLSINSIVIRISAKAFNASFELSQLQVYSVNTSWSISDLRFTRIQDPQRGEVTISFFAEKAIRVLCHPQLHHANVPCVLFQILTFKEISWQMIRIEADAIQSAEHEMLSAPIRLITNQSKIRVTLKRRVSHTQTIIPLCGLTGCRPNSSSNSLCAIKKHNNPLISTLETWTYVL